jgi:CBS domain-containing protein
MSETIDVILKEKGGRIWSVAPESTVFDAIAMMADKRIGALLVVTGEELVGIVTERDYARKVILQGRSSRSTLVRDIMTDDPITVSPRHTVDECLRLVTQYRIRHLPVLDQDKLAGVVSIGDLVNAIIAEQAHTIGQLHTYIGGGYPS